jgi:hypothetical protein
MDGRVSSLGFAPIANSAMSLQDAVPAVGSELLRTLISRNLASAPDQ